MERNIIHFSQEQTMTSLEIAEVTGKQHKNLMRDIRNMEPAWEKVCGLKFELTSRTIVQPNGGTREVPCYQLTKTECLYIATKFNDEARAKLVLRWQQLELAEQERRQQLCLPSPKKILAMADEIIGEGLPKLVELLTSKTPRLYKSAVAHAMFPPLATHRSAWSPKPAGTAARHLHHRRCQAREKGSRNEQ